ncbi:MAG TPA: diacylglycerol kinase family protein [Bacillaceae bacterium]
MNKARKKLVFIVNPAAKNGLSLKTWKRIEARLYGIPHAVYFTEYGRHAAILAKEAADRHRGPLLIVAVGGDGTIHEVANGIMHVSHVTLGYVPAGSGNDFARGYLLPSHPDRCIELILTLLDKEGLPFDAGIYTGRGGQAGYFVNSLGAGFDAAISMKANQAPVKKWLNYLYLGKCIYVFYLFAELFRYKPGKLELELDGEKLQFGRAWFVTVSNQPYYGGGMMIAPKADPSDGLLNVLVASGLSRMKLLMVFITVFWGGHTRFREVNVFTAKKVSIAFEDLVLVHADGEQAGTTPVDIQVSPAGWHLAQGTRECI